MTSGSLGIEASHELTDNAVDNDTKALFDEVQNIRFLPLSETMYFGKGDIEELFK